MALTEITLPFYMEDAVSASIMKKLFWRLNTDCKDSCACLFRWWKQPPMCHTGPRSPIREKISLFNCDLILPHVQNTCGCYCLLWRWKPFYCCCPGLPVFILCFFYPQTSDERHDMAGRALLPMSILEFKLQLYSKHLRGWNEYLSSGSPYERQCSCVSVAERSKVIKIQVWP